MRLIQPKIVPNAARVVLLGGGHSHLGVLQEFRRWPASGLRLTLISRESHTPYSGMLPGLIAGEHGHDEAHIDLVPLARAAGAVFIRDEVTGIEPDRKRVLCRESAPVAYDLLSIDTGAAPRITGIPGVAEHAVSIKPIDGFAARFESIVERTRSGGAPRALAVVGGGAAGVEVILAVQHRLRAELSAAGRDRSAVSFHLLTAGPAILANHNSALRRSLIRILAERDIAVHVGAEVSRLTAGGVETTRGLFIEADPVIWATQAEGAPWLRTTGLALDGHGFIRVADTLQTVTDPNIFASGDVASLGDPSLEKAGVFAVRQGPVLAANLRRAVEGRPLMRYGPQRSWLSILSTGGQYAVASRGSLKAEGRWVWLLKRWIDTRFVASFSIPATGAAGDRDRFPPTDETVGNSTDGQGPHP